MVTAKKCVITLSEVSRVIVEQASLCNLMESRVEVRRMLNKTRMLLLYVNAFTVVCGVKSAFILYNIVASQASLLELKRQKTLKTSLKVFSLYL